MPPPRTLWVFCTLPRAGLNHSASISRGATERSTVVFPGLDHLSELHRPALNQGSLDGEHHPMGAESLLEVDPALGIL